MNPKHITVLVMAAFVGGIMGGYMSNQLTSKGQAYANGVENSIDKEEKESAMDIRKKFEKSQNVSKHNREIAELIYHKILPEKEYEALLETARNEVRGMGLDEIREKVASLQATNISLLHYLGKYIYSLERKQELLSKP